MSVLASVQNGTIVMGALDTSVAQTIASIDTTKAFLVFNFSTDDNSSGQGQVTGQITNGTTLTFTRFIAGGPAITIEWYVAEFSSGVTVQRGSQLMDLVTKDVTITSVDLTKSFAITSLRADGTGWNKDDFVRAELTTATNLQLTQIAAGLATGIIEWQVIEYEDCVVQSGLVSFANADASLTATLSPSVDTAKSWLVFSYRSNAAPTSEIGRSMFRGVLTNSTTLTFDRDVTGTAVDLAWFLIEFTDPTVVQSGSENFSSVQTQKDVTITAVVLANTIANAGAQPPGRGGKTPFTSDDNPGVGTVQQDLTTTTNLQLTRALTGSVTADIGWFVIEFPAVTLIVASDSLDLEINEGVALLLGLIEPQDTLNLDLVEVTEVESQAGVQDTLDLEINEGVTQLLSQADVEDTLDLAVDEVTPSLITEGLTASDLLDLAILEDPAQVAIMVDALDTLDLTIEEGVTLLLGIISPQDLLDLAILEGDPDLSVEATAQDDLDLEIIEGPANLTALIEVLDNLDLEILEDPAVVDIVGIVLKIASDLLDIEINEDVGQVAAGITDEDTLSLEVNEDTANLLGLIQPEDTAGVSLDELTEILARAERLDTLDLDLIEAREILALLTRSDTLDLEILEDAGQIAVGITAEDDIDLEILEGIGQVVVGIQATDLLDLSSSEIAQVVAFLNRDDVLDLDLGEQADLLAFIQAADDLDIEILDVAALVVALQVADDLDIDLAEFSQIFNALSVLDTLGLEITEESVLQAMTTFEGIITKRITLPVTRSVRFTLEIDPGVQRP